MSNVESLMAHRIEKSQALIARVLPLIDSFQRAASDRKCRERHRMLCDSLVWSGQLIAVRTILDQSAMNLAMTGAIQSAKPDVQMLVTLRRELADLIDAVTQLATTVLEARASD